MTTPDAAPGNSGRRARPLRRTGLFLGAVCLGYAAVLGAAFLGWGTSLTPSQLLPFAGAGPGGGQPGEVPGGPGGPGVRPGGAPSAPAGQAASGTTPSPSTPSSPSASAGAN
ncbi:hypothetical protein ACF09Y_00720 [Streptomyces massasporeus]|uniref:hypothetical protein n=1 Tax=Streptomyces massasporeus TaxID=67324 RepID=UPI0036F52E97